MSKFSNLFDKLNPIKFFKEMISRVSATDLLMNILKKMALSVMGPIFKEVNEFVGKVQDTKDKIKIAAETMKFIAKLLKQILKLIIKAIVKIIQWIVQAVVWLVSTPPGWCVLAVILILLLFAWLSSLLEIFGGFRGTVIVDVDSMKERNVDPSDYTDLLNTDALLETFYRDVSDKSYYQMFNVRNMYDGSVDGITDMLVSISAFTGLWSEDGLNYEDRKNKTMQEVFANRKVINDGKKEVPVYSDKYVTGFSGVFNFPQYDPRYIYTDANKNPLKYLKKAEVVGTNTYTNELSAYFRDYYNREHTFMLSEELLYELNKYMYMDSSGKNSIVFPEAFTQPLHFVNDYMRIDDNKDSDTFGEKYVYVTQRVHLDDIRDQTSEFYGKYPLEGIIYTTPSKYVYDYSISDSNIHDIHSSDSSKQVNIGNVSDYNVIEKEIIYDENDDTDKDTLKEIVKLYWKIKDDKMDTHMGVMISENNVCNYFSGPYLTKTVSGDQIVLSDSLEICKEGSNSFNKKAKYAIINVDEDSGDVSYSLVDDKPDSGNFVDPKLNAYPRKHIQVAPIEDKYGNVFATSRNLFNKVYIQVKTIKNPFRSSDEYWARFSDFVDIDLERGYDATECTGDAFVEDQKLDWSARKCSVIRRYMSLGTVNWIKSKGAEFIAFLQDDKDAKDATLNINEQAMYAILIDYENYLMSVGTQDVEWEYKYFSQTENDKLNSMAEYSGGFLKWINGNVVEDIKKLFGDDSKVYEDTFDTVVEMNNKRSVASEYVPVAIITGNELAADGSYNNQNTWGWGYKYTGEKVGGNYKVKKVYGEASMQFPEYYTYAEDIENTVYGTIWSNVKIGLNQNTMFFDSPMGKVVQGIIDFVKETDYGEVTYGFPNFKYYWKNGKLEETVWYGNDDSSSSNAWLDYKTVKDSNGEYIDFRNDEYAWNPKAEVWRPDESTSTMTKCIGQQCGRVTTQVAPDDYLPMEVRGVRDYGLGSILSYIESRKVVFNTGVAMTEKYNKDGIKEYVKQLNDKLGQEIFKADDALKGYLPKEVVGLEFADISVNTDDGAQSAFMNIYRKSPVPVEKLKGIAHAFTNAQGTGSSSVTIDGCTYSLLSKDQFKSYDNMAAAFKVSGVGSNCAQDLYAFVPNIETSLLENFWNWLTEGDRGYHQDQFWDPMYYYMSWFDYFNEEINTDLWSKELKFLPGDQFYSVLDTPIAAKLREIKNSSSSGSYSLAGVSDVSYWFQDAFAGAGNLSTGEMDEFFIKYGDQTNPLDLIDKVQSQKVYLIEEAATFIGEFMYTYKDTMETIANLTEKDAVISDLAFIDRYYYVSNYIFALQSTHHGLETKSFSDSETESASEAYKKWIKKLKKDDGYDELNPPPKWWEFWKWFNKKPTFRDYDKAKLLSKTKDGVTYYLGVVPYATTKIQDTIIFDTPQEIIKLIEELNKTTAGQATAKKVMINLKVYDNLGEAAGFVADNTSDIKDGINYTGDAVIPKSGDYSGGTYFEGKNYGVSNLDNFSTNDKIYDNIDHRKGFVVNKAGKTNPDKMKLTDNKNFNDVEYEIGFENNTLSPDLVSKISKLETEDLERIRSAILKIYGQSNSKLTKKEVKLAGKSTGYWYKEGNEWSDEEEMMVSILYADRSKEGFPLPLYMHVAGDTKEIMPDMVSQFFDGEELQSWKKRVELRDTDKEDSDSIYREKYVKNYRKDKESYLYDYLENFEVYLPLDVKSDSDMQLRGKDTFLSLASNDVNQIEILSSSTNAINSAVANENWLKLYNRFGGIKENSMAQLIAGLLETSIEKAPIRTITEYNFARARNGQVLIDDGYQNQEAILNAIKETMYIENTGSTNVSELRTVKLKLVDDTEVNFVLPYVGVASIKNIDYAYNNCTGKIVGDLNTENIGGKANDDKRLTINNSRDDRLVEHTSIEYAAVKFRKLINKYGGIPAAIIAYSYGETYWENLKKVAEEEGLSTGPEWYVASDDMIEKAVRETIGDDTAIVDAEQFTPYIVDDVLSYVLSQDDRLKMIRSQITMLDTNLPEGQNDAIVFAYAKKLMGLDDQHALSLMAVLGGESGGWESRRLEGDYGDISESSLIYIDTVNRYISNGDISGKRKFEEKCGSANGFGIAQWTACDRKRALLELAKEKQVSIGDLPLQLEYLQFELEGGWGNWKNGKSPYTIFLETSDPFEQVDILVRNFEIPADKTKAVNQRMGIRADLEANFAALSSAAGTIPDGSLTASGGISGSQFGSMLSGTIAFNSYTRDELSLQNSGIELWIPPRTFKRNDIDLVMLSQGSRDGNFLEEAHTYDLLSLFTSRKPNEDQMIVGGSWEYGDTAIHQLGKWSTYDVPKNELTGMIPLFRINRVFKDYPLRVTSQFGYRDPPKTSGGQGSRNHGGIDLGTHTDTPDIFAIAPGEVTANAYQHDGAGYYVRIEHYLDCISSSFKQGDDYVITNGGVKYKILGVQSYYMHMLQKSEREVGYKITPENIGERIGITGSTGNSSGNHLHFEIRVRVQIINDDGTYGRKTDYIKVDPLVWFTTSWYANDTSGGSGTVIDGDTSGSYITGFAATTYGNTPEDDNGVCGWNSLKYKTIAGHHVAIPCNLHKKNTKNVYGGAFSEGYGTVLELRNPSNGKTVLAVVADCGSFGLGEKYPDIKIGGTTYTRALDLPPNTQSALGITTSSKIEFRKVGKIQVWDGSPITMSVSDPDPGSGGDPEGDPEGGELSGIIPGYEIASIK